MSSSADNPGDYLEQQIAIPGANLSTFNSNVNSGITSRLNAIRTAASPEFSQVFGTHGLVKVRGTIDGHPFKSSFMAMGDGRHMLPVKVEIRRAIGKQVGETADTRPTKRRALKSR